MFADTHCHLCPGLDDGAKSLDEAIEMCRLAWNEGVRMAAVTGHQNPDWPLTPQQIIAGASELATELERICCDLKLVPMGEVMLASNTLEEYREGKLLSIGNQNKYLLIEFPHNQFFDISSFVSDLVSLGVRPVLAHAERYPQLLHGGLMVDGLIRRGCVIQVSSAGIIDTRNREGHRAIRDWARRNVIHVVGSDAHSPRRRRPLMHGAYHQLANWTSESVANAICWKNGVAVMNGRKIAIRPPQPVKRGWLRA